MVKSTIYIHSLIVFLGLLVGCGAKNKGETSPNGDEKAEKPVLPEKAPAPVMKPKALPAAGDPEKPATVDKEELKKKSPQFFCEHSSDCVFAPPHPCSSGPCGENQLRPVVNKTEAQRRKSLYARARFKCKKRVCKGSWAENTSPACVQNLCKTVKNN